MNIKDNCKIIEASLTKYNKHAEYHQIIIEMNSTNDNKITSEVNKTISSFYTINRFGQNGGRVSTAARSTNQSELK